MRKIILLGVFIVAPIILSAQTKDFIPSSEPTNVRNEVGVSNTQLVFFTHFLDELDPALTAKKFFSRYLYYYNSTQLRPTEAMMDSFLFSDLGYKDKQSGWHGEYKADELSNYLDNFFKQTKMPLTRMLGTNSVGRMRANKFGELSLKFNNFKDDTEYEVTFDAKLQSSQPSSVHNLYHGVQFFDDLVPVDVNSTICSTPLNVSSFYETCGKFITLTDSWSTTSFKFTVPSQINQSHINDYVKINFINWTLPNGNTNEDFLKEIYIDNVSIKECSTPGGSCSGSNLVQLSTDINFNIAASTPVSNWEYEHRIGTKVKRHLFEDKKALLGELWQAKNQYNIPSDVTKVVLMLPEIQANWNSNSGWTSIYTNPIKAAELETIITNYISELDVRFNAWKSNSLYQNATIEIAGLYYLGEDFRDSGRRYIVQPFLEHARDELNAKGWKLFGSPFVTKLDGPGGAYEDYYCDVKSSFSDDLIQNVFDFSWQQPGAFFNVGSSSTDIDRDFLEETALKLMRLKKMGANIESRKLSYDPAEPYGRVRDYYDYGNKFRYNNYPKLYYDTNGAHYSNSFSSIPIEKVDYDELYEFIRKGRKGVLANGDFENHEDGFILFNWGGNSTKVINDFSTTKNRFLQFNTSSINNQHDSELIPVTDDDKIYLTLRAKEITNDNEAYSGLVGINFYDNNGLEITNMNTTWPASNITGYSTYLDAFYLGIGTSTSFNDFEVFFTPPSTAVSMKFFLYRYGTASVLWKDVKLHRVSKNTEPEIFYTYPTQPILQKENRIKNGTAHIKLDHNKYSFTTEKISVDATKPYSFSVDVKEELPILNFNKNNKALIGVLAYNSDGVQLSNSTAVTGMNCCSTGNNMFFKYIPFIDQVWKTYTTGPITFHPEVASIKIELYNWFYDNPILMDNLKLEYHNDNYQEVVFPSDNLLKKSNWNEAFPISVVQHEPAYYNELIDVSGINSLKFSAMFRDKGVNSSSVNRLLAIELLDDNYNLLTDDDITSSQTNLSYSTHYKYWYTDYLDVFSLECNNGNLLKESYWKKLEQNFSFPSSVKWIRLSVHHLNSTGELRMLNPILTANTFGTTKKNTLKRMLSSQTVQTDKPYRLYPNPTYSIVSLEFLNVLNSETSYTLYDVTGKLVGQGVFKENKNNISLDGLNSGIYVLTIQNDQMTATEKIIKQ